MRKLVTLFLILCLLPLCGLAENQSWRGDFSNLPISAEKTELNVWAVVMADVEDIETNAMTKELEEMTNVHVNWTAVGTSDRVQQLNLSLAGGNYPDIYMTPFDITQIQTYGMEEGILIPLEELIEQYAPNVRFLLENSPAIKKMITAPDGHIYTLFRQDSSPYPSAKLYTFLPWVEQYKSATGKEEPKTLDEFRTMLEYYRDHDMNGNGDATDEIPLVGSYQYDHDGSDPMYAIMNCFTYFPMNLFYVQDNQVKFAAMGDDFREGLKYVRQMIVDGLLDELTYTQDLNQFRAVVNVTKPEEMRVGVAAAPYQMRCVTKSIYTRADEDFFVLPPLEGPTGLHQTPMSSSGSTVQFQWAITKDCKDPVAAIKWMDCLATREADIRSSYGLEGEHYTFNGVESAMLGPEIVKIKSMAAEGASTQNIGWSAWLVRVRDGMRFRTFVEYAEPEQSVHSNEAAHNVYRPFGVEDGIPSAIWSKDNDLILEHTELNTQICDYAANMWTQFLLGVLDINDDAQWAAYEQGLADLDLEHCIEVKETLYGMN